MVVHGCNSCTWEAEAGGLPSVQGQSGLYSEFQATWDYSVKPCLKTNPTQGLELIQS